MCSNIGVTQAPPGMPWSLMLRLSRPDRTRKTVFVLAAIPLIIGGIMAGTGIAAIQSGQAPVSQLRRHSAVATAVIGSIGSHTIQTRGGTATITDRAFVFRLPGGQTALTDDTSFDGTYSAAPPANDNATSQVTVRYDPAKLRAAGLPRPRAAASRRRSAGRGRRGSGQVVVDRLPRLLHLDVRRVEPAPVGEVRRVE